jgi:heptaprenyl diphosphate synthase
MHRRITRLAVLMALGLALHMLEGAVALPVLLPGAKLGLANVATLLVLAEYGPLSAAVFTLVRHVLGSLAGGMLLLPTFWLGMGGSLAVVAALVVLGRRTSLSTVGVVSGAAFQVGQGAALVLLGGSATLVSYIPPLLALGVGAGWVTGGLAGRIVRVLHPITPTKADQSGPVALMLLAGALALGLVLVPGTSEAGEVRARVLVAGEERMVLRLDEDRTVPLDAAGGRMVIQVSGGRIRVAQSDCRDQICVLTGWVSRPGNTILCAPYRVLILLEGSAPDLDGVVSDKQGEKARAVAAAPAFFALRLA